MIRPVSFVTNYNYLKSASKKVNTNYQSNFQNRISFTGLMDNPDCKRVTDANGNTYVIEPGGHLTINNNKKDGNGGVKGTLTGAGAGAVGGSAAAKNHKSSEKKSNDEDLKNHEVHKQDDVDAEDVSGETTDAEEVSTDELTTEESDFQEDEYEDCDDDESVFDDDAEIYVF